MLSILPVALLIAVGVFLGLASLVAIFVIVVVANRAEPDRSGWRPWAVYFFGMSFVSLFVTVFGTFAIILGLVQLIGSHPAPSLSFAFPPSRAIHPIGDAVARDVVLSGLITLVGAVLLATHVRRGLALPEWRRGHNGPINRVAQTYVATVCFASLVIAASAFVSTGYQLFRVIAPGVSELTGPRVDAVRLLLASLYLTIAAAMVAVVHARLPPGGFFISSFSSRGGRRGGDANAPPHTGTPSQPAPGMPPPPPAQHPGSARPATPPPPPPRPSPPESAPAQTSPARPFPPLPTF